MNFRSRFIFVATFSLAIAVSAGATDRDTLLQKIANTRSLEGLKDLRLEDALVRSAETHARELLRRGVLSHVDENGGRVHDRYRQYGGYGRRAGEILAAGSDIDAVVEAWMRSPTHRAVLLSSRWRRIGVAVIPSDSGRIVAVALFSDSLWIPSGDIRREETSLILEGTFVGNPETEKPRLRVQGRVVQPERLFGDPPTSGLRFVIPIPFGYVSGDTFSAVFVIDEDRGPAMADTLFLTVPR